MQSHAAKSPGAVRASCGSAEPVQLIIYGEGNRRIETLCRAALGTHLPAPHGVHHILELYGCPAHILNDASLLSEIMDKAAATSNSTLLNKLVHSFPTEGVTAMGLLAESHIAIHTWPELGYAAVDFFACGKQAQPDKGCAYLIEALRASRFSAREVQRGAADSAPGTETANAGGGGE